ncbi:hypothetical protein HY523_02430 [Candidatus Berkelbacteria bacterium]|nr:hypothetical protein [Candidatus Berkelbacteria bacterium]
MINAPAIISNRFPPDGEPVDILTEVGGTEEHDAVSPIKKEPVDDEYDGLWNEA